MSGYTITMTLPNNLYERLQNRARAMKISVGEVVTETLIRSLPPLVESDLPLGLQSELRAMEHLSDEALWQIAEGTLNPEKAAFIEVLLERNREGTLTQEGHTWLTQLQGESQALTLRKAHAYALLQSRGYQLPSLEELQTE